MAIISDKEKQYLLSLKPSDLTFSMLVSLFGDTVSLGDEIKTKTRSRFNTTDEMTLSPKEYFVKEPTQTTVGRFIYNKYIIERLGFQDIVGYVNFAITNKKIYGIEAKLSKALIEDKITMEVFHKYIDYRDTLGMQLNSVITTSFTPNTIKLPTEVRKKKDELFKKYDKELDDGDVIVAEKIQKELIADTKKALAGDPGLDLYNSEARGNFENFKNMTIFKGASMNNITGKYEIVRSAFMDGIRKEDISSFGTDIVSGAYPKAVGTQVSGYLAKELTSGMQSERLDEIGSDCGTTKTIPVVLTEKNKRDFIYRYIVDGGKLVELTPDEMPKRIGTTIQLRSPMYCKNDKICNICAGNMDYKLGNINVGLGCSKVATVLLKCGMKKFHIASIASNQIDVDDLLL